MIVEHSTYSRMGLLGNPSDGFGGKTLTVQIRDFAAILRLWESPELTIRRHPRHDPFVFESLAELHRIAEEDGYYGGTRLLYAACKRFYEYCTDNGVRLRDANFTIDYDTTIPRQVGLGGSSAIVVGILKCLMRFHGLSERDIPRELQPQLALSVEEELGIKAGLQDRVAQVYGGLVYMDFDPRHMSAHGHGLYEKLPLDLLPALYLAYVPHSTTTSGEAHNLIHYRYDNGDREVREAMAEFARYADLGREALEGGDVEEFGRLMDRNFDLRRRIYGDEVIGEDNLAMIRIAREFGLPAKFTGSGGAITGVLREDVDVAKLQRAFESRGYHFLQVTPVDSASEALDQSD
ncbi:MAG: mevalonate kinase family protein [Armatimonadota bacterium]